MARVGRKKVRVFRLIASEKIKSPKRGALEILGYYHPENNPATLKFDKARTEELIKNGAELSPTVARLFAKEGVKGAEKFVDSKKVFKKTTKDPEKLEAMKKAEEEKNAPKEEPKAEEAPAEAPAEEPKAEEAPVEEAPAEEEKKEEAPAEETKSE